ncbi:hypothetical protein [Amycolatopsis sp. lyj-23]|uniref:hypothetical protein n=1 Tax=Amycolatopsis sp. lyj-23 TaxID=2789283 RepID=UPI0039794514
MAELLGDDCAENTPGSRTFDGITALLAGRRVPLAEVLFPANLDEIPAYWLPSARAMVYEVAGAYYGQARELDSVVSSNAGIP